MCRLPSLPSRLPACTTSCRSDTRDEPTRIGVLLPQTGPLAKNGIENWEAMQIARDMINERGGVGGRRTEYLLGDANTPNAAISETERLSLAR
jgi:branched-chain amino acid transport system substrate-binding protein